MPHDTAAKLPLLLLLRLAALQDKSDLFRHDVAFCLGQRQDPSAVSILKQLVADAQQHPM
jgi:deoxyhypusine monooxygenase